MADNLKTSYLEVFFLKNIGALKNVYKLFLDKDIICIIYEYCIHIS